MEEQLPRVPFTRWEIVFWSSAGAAAMVNLVSSTTTVTWVIGTAGVVIFVGTLAWARWIHRKRPDLFTQRLPAEVLWVLGAAGVLLVGTLLIESTPADKLLAALLAVGIAAAIINEVTREIPEGSLQRGSSGGYFDPTTAEGRTRFVRTFRVGLTLVGVGLLGIYLATGESFALFFLLMVPFAAIGFEGMLWFARKRKLGYFALEDDD